MEKLRKKKKKEAKDEKKKKTNRMVMMSWQREVVEGVGSHPHDSGGSYSFPGTSKKERKKETKQHSRVFTQTERDLQPFQRLLAEKEEEVFYLRVRGDT